ncbi:MAG: ribonuclease HII [Proteobacteria bacterium]|nr:ribonuclease HII [Pseudomonadota bacterium]
MGLFDAMACCLIAGVDEAGRGPLAGPVVAGAVILCQTRSITGLRDSKKLTEAQRNTLALEIRHRALAVGVGQASVEEIDEFNILRASHLAMRRAIGNLSLPPDLVLVDGNLLPPLTCPAIALVKGDDRIDAISAGAILAKTERDRQMKVLAELYPQYGFAEHKGYATRAHLAALKKHGPSPIHRRSFAPVREADGHARQAHCLRHALHSGSRRHE